MYFSFEPKLHKKYHEEVQILFYDVNQVQTLDYDVHISKEGELLEHGNQDVGNLDTSINLDASGDEYLQLGSTNQEVCELDLSGITLDQSCDAHLESKSIVPPSFESLTPQATDTPNQSLAKDVLEVVRK